MHGRADVEDLSHSFERSLQRAGIAQIADCDLRRSGLQQLRSGFGTPQECSHHTAFLGGGGDSTSSGLSGGAGDQDRLR
jgi:hypothetical protein